LKKKFRGISLLIVILLVTTFISVKTSKASDVATQPNFTIQDLKATPDPAKVGEDILVIGEIVPEDFETIVQPKEIVLVLDTSGSMDHVITSDEECTEKKVRYCTTHNSSEPNHPWWGGHKWTDDYCEIHKKIGKHNKVSTKINELKKAAKSFIETMKDVPNLKIGIIGYSTDATIVSELKVANDKSLSTSVDKLKADGGTNIREGLRKAAYLFSEGNNNANKTIVLMTDGKANYYSEYEKLDNTNPTVHGKGNSTDNDAITYTKNLAEKQIRDNNYNAYSIGYGLDTSGTEYLKSIHSSMKGLDSKTEVNQENGFFEKNDGSITEIFNQIAENIKSSYDLNKVSLEVEFNQGFKLNIEGNEVNIGNILYKKVSENNGRVVYRADQVSFSFIVRASQIGENQSMFNKLTIKYPWNDTIKEDIKNETLNINIVINDLPSISAELSDKIIETKKDNEITFKYEIKPEDFSYNNSQNSGEKDVLFIMDIAKAKSQNGQNNSMLYEAKKAIHNKIMNTSELINSNTKYSVITFNSEAKLLFDFNYLGHKDSGSYVNSINKDYVENIQVSGEERDIGKSLLLAKEALASSRANTTKNIVIISNNDVTYNESDYRELINRGYNIITLSYNNIENTSNLYKLHKALGGKDEDVVYAGNEHNSINNSKMDLVKNKIVSFATAKPYEFNPVIKLDLGNNFTAIKGIDSSGTIKIPTITYNLTENNNYHADSQVIEVILKVNNLSSGEYGFGVKSDNTMTYSSLLGENVVVNLETPIVKIKDEVKDLVHGLYSGIIDNELVIEKSSDENGFTLSVGSMVTFAASFKGSGSEFNLALSLNNKVDVKNNEIKVYKLINNGDKRQLVELSRKITSLEDNLISINAINSDNTNVETEFVVIYKGKIREESIKPNFINEIRISDLKAEVKFNTPNIENPNEDYMNILPDLF